ncbi:MAG: hypothetical protein COX57_12100 [Alphaproteobacteria bacterium CG_4_10_14_0_2_um_filter_63_37]|nr:MAG: hypothetical protein AUJ55_09585 [Proteobacteria bacterium CG1_02_64_396]PJA23719.1 MAG: hypothetical protein COX57_12100 [Alphaproteobacteria bacterium CG_4_10_14_0_2_um_filter_63_37]
MEDPSRGNTASRWTDFAPQLGEKVKAIAVGDLNRDGLLDLVVGSEQGPEAVQIWMNVDGTTWRPGNRFPVDATVISLALGDIDGDGGLDLAVGVEGNTTGLLLWRNQDFGRRWHPLESPARVGRYPQIALADINRDGRLDLIAPNATRSQEGGIQVWPNVGQGHWGSNIGPAVTGLFHGVVVDDIDGDSVPDLVATAGGNDGGLFLWRGYGDGRWQVRQRLAEGDLVQVIPADMDGDGRLDLVTTAYMGGVRLFRQGGDSPSGWEEKILTVNGSFGPLGVGDLDRDGDLDVLAGSISGQGLWQWRNDGGRFQRVDMGLPDRGIVDDLTLADGSRNQRLDVFAVFHRDGLSVLSEGQPSPVEVQIDEDLTPVTVGEPLRVYFDAGIAELQPAAKLRIQRWAKDLESDPSLELHIDGFTDERQIHSERFASNHELSLARAQAVANLIAKMGVQSSRMKVQGLGDQNPLVEGHDEQAWGQNRRVEVQMFRRPVSRRDAAIPRSSQTADGMSILENKIFKMVEGRPEYKIGPGDVLTITLWEGSQGSTFTPEVLFDGTLSFTYFDKLKVEGLTPSDIDQVITERLSNIVRNPRVDVQVKEHKAHVVTLFGSVQSLLRQPTGPGPYKMSGRESLLEFISRAGGPTSDADLNHVQVRRGEKTMVVNLYKAMYEGDQSQDLVLDAGDTVIVPSQKMTTNQIFVLGEVNKPGIVSFQDQIHLLEALTRTDSWKPSADLSEVRVVRTVEDRPVILAVDFNRLLQEGDLRQNVLLENNDIVLVPTGPIDNWNAYIQKLMPSFSLITQPLSVFYQLYILQQLGK